MHGIYCYQTAKPHAAIFSLAKEAPPPLCAVICALIVQVIQGVIFALWSVSLFTVISQCFGDRCEVFRLWLIFWVNSCSVKRSNYEQACDGGADLGP